MPPLIAELLVARGITTAQTAETFLTPRLSQLHDPYLMCGMRSAVERILHAIGANESILIYGDYDVDGTIATVLLKTAIERVARLSGSAAKVRYHVPHRIREGYGMQTNILADAHADGVTLVISVDTGIRAFAAAEECQRLGLELIVTDHHLPDELGIPHALAVLNPNQSGCDYPCKHLCGAGVAFKLAQALLEGPAMTASQGSPDVKSKILLSFLKLLAIATIADAVPLIEENRVITAIGLKELRNPVQPGLRELMRLAELDPAKEFTATDIAFRIAPRINAAGRMDIADDVVELFLTRDAVRARELAEKLHRLNDERRATEAAALKQIEARLSEMQASSPPATATTEANAIPCSPHPQSNERECMPSACLILDDQAESAARWHRGVIGILASRVVDRTHRPAIIITHEVDDNGVSQAYGSGRSISGFHLLDAITAAHLGYADAHGSELFSRFGGHAHAIGFQLPSSLLPEFRRLMNAYSAQHLTPDLLTPHISCDAELTLDRIEPALFKWLARFEPLGMGNATPVFIARNVRIAAPPRIMKEKHLRLRVQQGARGTQFNCLGWNWAAKAASLQLGEHSMIDLAYKLKENTHPDFGGLELEICDLQLSV